MEAYSLGMSVVQAGKAAGLANPYDTMKAPRVREAIAAAHKRNQEIADIRRSDVIEGLKEAIDMARVLEDPISMIAGWREIAKVCGHYEPKKAEVTVSFSGQIAIQRLQQLPDDELLKVLEAEVIDVIEAEESEDADLPARH